MKHTLSPVVEYGLVALVACYGFFAVYMTSLHPFVEEIASPVRSVVPSPALDTDLWRRRDDFAHGLIYGVPPGWVVEERGAARVVLAPSLRHLPEAGAGGQGMQIERVPLPDGQSERLAAVEFAGLAPALYDVTVDGRQGLFAVAFANGRIRAQAVYVPDGDEMLVLRGGPADPAVFSAFVSTVKFAAEPSTP